MAEQLPSKKQHELLEYIEAFIKSNGYGPSYREIMRALDYKSVSTVAVHVDGLIARGYLNKRDRSARSLEVVATPQMSGKAVDKTVDNSHHLWLKSVISAKLTALESASGGQKVNDVRAIAAGLQALGFDDEVSWLNVRVSDITKRLDQTPK